MFVPDAWCPRCGGSIIPDDTGDYECMMCGRAIIERDGSIVLLVERPPEAEYKERRGWGMRSR